MATNREKQIQMVMKRWETLKAQREPFMSLYQAVAYFVRARRMNFQSDMSPGQFLTGQIWDSTATQAAHTAASTYVGQIFPTADKTIRIDAPYSLRKRQSKEVQDYFDEVTRRVRRAFSNPTAGFSIAYDEHWLDRVVFGTSGMRVESTTGDEKYTVPVRFRAIDAKVACIAEGVNGYIDTIYMERELTVRQCFEEYSELENGNEGVSEATRRKYEAGKFDETVKVLHVIEPRLKRSKRAYGNRDMPIASIHIEIDQKHCLRESGMEELDTFISRFWKDKNEVYGRSPATEALPEIITLDGFSETLIEAAEKTIGPPMIVMTDALAGGEIDLSANATNEVIDPTAMIQPIGGKVIEPIFQIGDLKPTYEEKGRLQEAIYTAFSVDRLLDLNNKTRMTLGEASIRNELRGQSLSSVYSREIAEVCDPMVRRVVHILFEKDLLGVVYNGPEHIKLIEAGIPEEEILFIPDEIVEIILRPDRSEEFFDVTFISPAARILQQETMLGIERTLEYAIRVQPIAPEVMDVINIDEVTRQVQYLSGAPANLLRSPVEVMQIRQARQEQQQKMMEIEAAKMQAETARAGGAAVQSVSEAANQEQQQ